MEPTPARPKSVVLGATTIASAALVLSLVTSAFMVARAYEVRGEQPFRHARTLEVSGSARARIRSDLAQWSVRVAGEGKSLEEAYQQLAAAADGVRAFLAKQGFDEPIVAAGAIVTTTHFKHDDKGHDTREVQSYALSRSFGVTSPDIERVAKAAGEVTELVKAGLHVESGAPKFIYTKLADLKVRMIGEATANARERAETIAKGSGCAVGSVKEARAGVLQIVPPWSTEVSGGGISDTGSIEKDATAVVHITFVIER